jgi:ferredoxin-like protein FixX
MVANYGYEDGSGTYYISLDTDKCSNCKEKGCIKACPSSLFQVELNDWDDEVVVINKCNTLGLECARCKSMINDAEELPCQAACMFDAITHSW